MFKSFALPAVLCVAALSAGCASVDMATPEQDAQAKSFQTTAGQANIYVYRNETMGAAVKMPVTLDGMLVGSTVAHSYLMLKVPAGDHKLTSATENDSALTLTTQPGQNYFVWQEVKMGVLQARSKLQVVSETEGRAGVNDSKLIQAK